MYIPKRYGVSREDNCPFCGKQGVTKNSQGISVCLAHKNEKLDNFKCSCGSWLESRSGKYGAYFNCMNCGNISFSKAIELNPNLGKERDVKQDESPSNQIKANRTYKAVEVKRKDSKKEITIRSDELDFYY